MEKLDNLLKFEKIMNFISDSVKRELEDFKLLKNQELENFKKEMEEKRESEKERIRKSYEREMERLRKLHDSRKSLLLSQERSKLKSKMFDLVRRSVEKMVSDLKGDDRKKYLRFLFEDARRKVEGDFKLLCKEEDAELVKEFFDGDVEVADVDGIVLISGRMRVVADINTLMERLEDEVMSFIDEKVGDLR